MSAENIPADMPPQVAAAVKPGHVMAADHPWGMTAVRRWTCTDNGCGAAVLEFEGRVYGEATTDTCDEAKANWAQLDQAGLLGGARS